MYFFKILRDFEGKRKDPLICDAFINDWKKYEKRLRSYCNENYKTDKHTLWPDDIEDILLLLKLLPHKPRGKRLVKSFLESISKFIVFRVVSNVLT